MPSFVLVFEDDPTVEVSAELRAEHRAYFLGRGERTIVAGPTFDADGGLSGRVMIADFDTLEEAQAFAHTEPLVVAGRAKLARADAITIVQQRAGS